MKVRRILAAGAGVVCAVAIAVALESGNPARALGPPADGNYTYNEAGVSGLPGPSPRCAISRPGRGT